MRPNRLPLLACLALSAALASSGGLPGAERPAPGPAPTLELYSFPSLDPLRDAAGNPVLVPVTSLGPGPTLPGPTRRAAVREGGFSGLAAVPEGNPGAVELWTISDRGPNLAVEQRVDGAGNVFGPGAKYFPAPAYNQGLFRLRLHPDRTVEVVERVGLHREGKPINGLPSSHPDRRSGETACASLEEAPPRSALPPSPLGYDFEGVHATRTAGGGLEFWTCEEYGPSVQVFDARGNLIREFVPGAGRSGEGTPASPAIAPLPRVLKHRMRNRGFEGLAGTSRHVFALLQSPLDPSGGDSGEPGSGNPGARLHRLVRIDKATGEAAQFAYDHLPDPERFGTTHLEVRTGDLAPLDDSGASFLVFESSLKLYSRLYRITITSETTVLDDRVGVGYEAGRVPYRAVESRLAADLTRELAVLPVPAKVEGLVVLDFRTLLLLFDNDYGFGSNGVETFELPDVEKRSLLLKLSSPGGF